jgi:transcriptional regulator with XRE-family HTH domain
MRKPIVNYNQVYSFVNPRHIRAARAWLGWNLKTLEEKTGLALDTISRYERGAKQVRPDTIAAMARAFEKEGVYLVPDGIRARDMK